VVRDGVDASSPVIAQFCNAQRSEQVVSSGRHLYVDFIVDGRGQSNGFEASYEFVAADHPAEPAFAAAGQNYSPAPALQVDSPTLLQQTGGGRRYSTDKETIPTYHVGEPVGLYSVLLRQWRRGRQHFSRGGYNRDAGIYSTSKVKTTRIGKCSKDDVIKITMTACGVYTLMNGWIMDSGIWHMNVKPALADTFRDDSAV